MSCYICTGEPKNEALYVCHTCGGMVCAQHGKRIDDANTCLCDNCPRAALSLFASRLLQYLERPMLFSTEERIKLEGVDRESLMRTLQNIV